MSVTPGAKFSKPPQEAPTLTEIVNSYEDSSMLIPEKSTTLYASFGPRITGERERGAMITVHGPQMTKYDDARADDPGALFSYNPPTVQSAYASKGDQHVVPSLLALAHKKTGVGKGVMQASDSLSAWSYPLAKKFADKGLATVPSWHVPNGVDFSISGSELADMRVNIINNRSDTTKDESYEYTYPFGAVDRQEIKADVPLEGALKEGREHLKKVLRGSKNVPVVPRHAKPISNMPGQEKLF